MPLFLLAYFGGILTILSPCILPVLPFVFARSDRPFRKSGLPLLAGMALTVEYPFDYVLALSWGILFQYFAIAPMRHLAVGEGLKSRPKRTSWP